MAANEAASRLSLLRCLVQARESLGGDGDREWAERRIPFFEREEMLDEWLRTAVPTEESGGESFDVGSFVEGWEQLARRAMGLGAGQQRSQFDLGKFEAQAALNWDAFYKRNTTKFFKDRHYLDKDFDVLRARIEQGAPCSIMEVGSGVGNAILPLTLKRSCCTAYGLDFAPTAIELLNASAIDNPRCSGFVCDISQSPAPARIPGVDFCTLVFVLSAVAPDRMHAAVVNTIERLKPGGHLLFRDYGRLDQAQLRFAQDQRLGHSYYVRQDGTRSFFFSLEGMAWLFERQCGLERVEAREIRRVVLNRAAGLKMRRVFMHATYRKPCPATASA